MSSRFLLTPLAFAIAVLGLPALAAPVNIPAGPLSSALAQYAQQQGIHLSLDAKLTQGKMSRGVHGDVAVQDGLRTLLSGTDLEFWQASDGTYSVRSAEIAFLPMVEVIAIKPLAVVASAGEVTLPTIEVNAAEVATGSAAQGYRVSKASVGGFGEQAILDTPFSIRVVPTELFENLAINNIGGLDLVDASVSGSASIVGYYPSPMIRGFDVGNWNNFRYNGMMMVNQQTMGLENKERVEILKGLSALQGGFGAPGGLINFVTKRPLSTPLSAVHVDVNDDGNARAHVDLSRQLFDGALGLRLNAATEALRSYVDGVDGDRQFISLAADWKVTSDTILKLDIEHERRDTPMQTDLQQNVEGQIPNHVNPTLFQGQDWTQYKSHFTIIGAKLEHYFNDQWSSQLDVNWGQLKRDQKTILLSDLQTNGDASMNLWFFPDQTMQPSNQRLLVNGVIKTENVTHQLVVGMSAHQMTAKWGDGYWGIIGKNNIYSPVPIAFPNPEVGSSYVAQKIKEEGAFFNDVMSFGDAWQLHLGGRYAKRNDTSFDSSGAETSYYKTSAFSPSAAVLFKPTPTITSYLSYIEGLEQGGIAPLGTENHQQMMKPLVSEQWEVGVKGEFNEQLSAELSLFQIEKAAEYTNTSNYYVQDGRRIHRGLELGLTGKLNQEFTIFASAMLLDAKFKETGDVTTENKQPAAVPEQRLALTTEYAPTVLDGWVLSGNWSYTSKRPLNDQNTGDWAAAYSLFGLGARYTTKMVGAETTLRLNISNLLNEKYWNTNNGNWPLSSGAPRSISAGVDIAF